MKFYSTSNPSHLVNLSEAVVKGLAPDQGLYMPETIPVLEASFFAKFSEFTFREIGYKAIAALFC